MRDILCRVTRIEPWNAGVSYAADLAARIGGIATGVYVHASPLDSMPRFGSSELFGTLLRHARERLALAQACGEAFVEYARALGARDARWQIAEGYVPAVLAHLALRHDVLVLERDEHVSTNAASELGRLLFGASLPCIVTPEGVTKARLERIALAWNGSLEAIRSIHAALPLIRRAASVILLRGESGASPAAHGWQPPFSIDAYLARHAIRARSEAVPAARARAGEALLAAATHAAADLLVMGAYGRSRVSEWTFGGATRTVLREARIPVFLHL